MEIKLFESEYRLADIVWEREPLGSGELARLCAQRLGWKKSTTYTVLKKLCDKGILRNENGTVTAPVSRDEAQRARSREVLEQGFGGSLSAFVAAFLGEGRISEQEAEEIRRLIDAGGKPDAGKADLGAAQYERHCRISDGIGVGGASAAVR